jgi:hypothetical protein
MDFLHFESTLKPFINMCGVNGKNERKMDPKDQGNFQKKVQPPPQQLFLHFLVLLCLIEIMILNKSNLKKIWHCS